MACSASFFDDDPVKEEKRLENRSKNEQRQIGQLTEFFSNNVGAANVDVQRVGGQHSLDATKMFLSKGDHGIVVEYRGYKITVSCNAAKWSLEFERWKKQGNMTHARLLHRNN